MISSVILGGITLKCNYLNKPIPAKYSIIEIPGREGDVIQYSNKASQEIQARGIIQGAAKDTDRTSLLGFIGTFQTYTDSEESFEVFVLDVSIPVIGGQPNHYDFNISCRKNMQV